MSHFRYCQSVHNSKLYLAHKDSKKEVDTTTTRQSREDENLVTSAKPDQGYDENSDTKTVV